MTINEDQRNSRENHLIWRYYDKVKVED